MSRHALRRLFSRNKIYAIYGPPLTFKTLFSLYVLKLTGRRGVYVGLGKHAFWDFPRKVESISFYPVYSLMDELELSIKLPQLSGLSNAVVIYDGFGANLYPLRFFLKEGAIMRIGCFVLSSLKNLSQARNSTVIVTVEGGTKPFFKRVLQEYVFLFIKTRTEEQRSELYIDVYDKKFIPVTTYTVPIEEVTGELDA